MGPRGAGFAFHQSRVAIAILSRPCGASRFARGEESGVAIEIITEALGAQALEPSGVLGDAQAVDGSDGRGANAWAPILEWSLNTIGQGVIGTAAWLAIAEAGAHVRALLSSARQGDVHVNVSRGAAAAIALHHVRTAVGEQDLLWVEAAEEPSALRHEGPGELNYVGIEPWIVSLVNANGTKRYIVVVSPQGDIEGAMKLPIGELERTYGRFAPRGPSADVGDSSAS
jgi:hypothetical protein